MNARVLYVIAAIAGLGIAFQAKAVSPIVECPLRPIGKEELIRPTNLRIINLTTGAQVTEFDQLDPLAPYDLVADSNFIPILCPTYTYVIDIDQGENYPPIHLGLEKCVGNGCKKPYKQSVRLYPGRIHKWTARFEVTQSCRIDNVCQYDDPNSIKSSSQAYAGPKFRTKEIWAEPRIFLSETYLRHGTNLGGGAGEGSLTHKSDRQYMLHGSKPLASKPSTHALDLISSFVIDNRFNAIDGYMYIEAMATSDCKGAITVKDIVTKKETVLVPEQIFKANDLVQVEAKLPGGIRRYISPIQNVMNRSGTIDVTATCSGSSPFNFGIDFMAIYPLVLANDEAGKP